MCVSVVLFVVDTFLNKEYDSSIIEASCLIIFMFYYFQAKYKDRFSQLLNPFIITLFVIINAVWITGGGLNLPNSFVFFLMLILVLLLAPKNKRPLYTVLLFIQLAFFIVNEFSYPAMAGTAFQYDHDQGINAIVMCITFSTSVYVLTFFRNQYDRERDLVREQNLKLDASVYETEAQNEELLQFQEEVLAQRDFIDEKNKILQQQAIELEKANAQIQEINNSLEKKVEERTGKLTELNNNMDLLVYRSSHDFRRPITTLMGLCEIARLTIKDKVSLDLFDKVNQTALKMDKMLLKFFMLYNINHFRNSYVGDSLEQIVDKIESSMISRKRNISFRHSIETSTYADYDDRNSLIEIILENLVENSLIYNSKEQIAIDLRIMEKEGFLYVFHEDNGNGIPISYQEKVFDMYFRGSTMSQGNGLGLFVVKRAVGLLSATIRFDTKEGEFTRFEIVFKI